MLFVIVTIWAKYSTRGKAYSETDEAQPVRDFLREAINTIRLDNLSSSQQPLIQANQLLSSIS